MEITKQTKLKEVLKRYPWLKDELIQREPRIKQLFGPVGKPLLEFGTIEKLSKAAGKEPEELIRKLNEVIAEHEAK